MTYEFKNVFKTNDFLKINLKYIFKSNNSLSVLLIKFKIMKDM